VPSNDGAASPTLGMSAKMENVNIINRADNTLVFMASYITQLAAFCK
jgi:hypothetical protein